MLRDTSFFLGKLRVLVPKPLPLPVAEPVLYHTNPYVLEWVDHPQGLGEALQPHHPAPSGRCRLPPLGTNAPGRAAAISLGGFPGTVPGDLLVRPAPKPDAGGASGR
jgi:hypothetical protein